ncbi:MAG TPA: DUF3108 domain-containing protein [Puia sp.]|jgi:hypothetical protein|nr:DUF3108 domain-containing protein [Puia sp.]
MRVLITVYILLLTGLSFSLLAVSPSGGKHRPPTGPGDTLRKAHQSQDSNLIPDPAFCSGLRNKAFNAGEVLTYKVYYGLSKLNIAAGEASFTTTLERFDHKDVYHVIGEGKTYSFEDKFFRVRDKYESYIDTLTLQPYKFIRDVDEGGYKTKENVTFIKNANTAITSAGVYKVPDCIQDVLSAIFYARNIDFSRHKPGDRIPFYMFLDRQVYPLYIRYLGKETIRTNYGKFRTIKFKPLLVKGTMFEGGEKMTVWVTDDPNHIAVRIESPITVGKVLVDMSYYRNLRYPLSSLVDL